MTARVADDEIDTMRTTIELPEHQVRLLDEIRRAEGVSRAELIRRAVTRYLEHEGPPPDDAFGIWRDRKMDGVAYKRKLRRDWSR